ncbi:MAG TPA: hypothetical protein VJ599_00970 [Nitrososphaeraceae archaeon]|nr:hypothetical protein [Nitrososphaeraceae archaeon]
MNLKWFRIIDPKLIPPKYIEQIKECNFTLESFTKVLSQDCVQIIDGKAIVNPLNLLFVLANPDFQIKGFSWMVVDPMTNSLIINSFSIDNEFWGSGKAVKLLEEKALEIKEGAKLDRVYWITRCPKHSEKYGFKRSKHVLMEYIGYGKSNRNEGETGGSSSDNDTGAIKLSE